MPFLLGALGALAVYSALTTGASLTMALVLLRQRQGAGGLPWPRRAGRSRAWAEDAGDGQDVEFYGPAPPSDAEAVETDAAGATSTPGDAGEGRRRRPLLRSS